MVLWEMSVAGEREGNKRNQVPVEQGRTMATEGWIGTVATRAEESICLLSS